MDSYSVENICSANLGLYNVDQRCMNGRILFYFIVLTISFIIKCVMWRQNKQELLAADSKTVVKYWCTCVHKIKQVWSK